MPLPTFVSLGFDVLGVPSDLARAFLSPRTEHRSCIFTPKRLALDYSSNTRLILNYDAVQNASFWNW